MQRVEFWCWIAGIMQGARSMMLFLMKNELNSYKKTPAWLTVHPVVVQSFQTLVSRYWKKSKENEWIKNPTKHCLKNLLQKRPQRIWLLILKQKRFKKIAYIWSHYLHLHWKFKLLAGKFTWGNKGKHCWVMSTNFFDNP